MFDDPGQSAHHQYNTKRWRVIPQTLHLEVSLLVIACLHPNVDTVSHTNAPLSALTGRDNPFAAVLVASMTQHGQDCGFKPMAVHPDYVKKACATFSSSFSALRELFDGSKAPQKMFNRYTYITLNHRNLFQAANQRDCMLQRNNAAGAFCDHGSSFVHCVSSNVS